MARRNIAEEIEADFEEVLELSSRQKTINLLREELAAAKQEAKLYKDQALNKVRQSLEGVGGKYKIAIKDIKPSQQCRQTFTDSAIFKRSQSLLAEGQLEPIILVPTAREANQYQLEDGELRWRAANYLVEQGHKNWEYLEAVIAPISPNEKELHRRSLIHHLHSEALNPLDRLEAVIREINWQIDLEIKPEIITEYNGDQLLATQDKLKKLLRNMHYFFKTNDQAKLKLQQLQQKPTSILHEEIETFELSKTQKELLGLLLELQISFQSFVANDLPMTSLSDDLKQAIRTKGLACHQALAINKLSAKNLNKTEIEAVEIRSSIIEEVVSKLLSVRKARQLVNQVLQAHNDQVAQKAKKSVSHHLNYIKAIEISELSGKEKLALIKVLEAKLTKLKA
ncbi:MAG: ParB/RepB/Spo0J family partition protein [Xenococcus sp. (in: cyanobacteria)]